MPTVMVSKAMWRALGVPEPLQQSDPGNGAESILGRWSANAIRFPEADLVLAVNELTYLAVLFPLYPLPQLLLAFGHSVGTLLSNLGYPDELCQEEAAAFPKGTVFCKNLNRSLIGTMNDLAIFVDRELEIANRSDPETLRRVQLRLSETPHCKREPAFPRDAAKLLFAPASRA